MGSSQKCYQRLDTPASPTETDSEAACTKLDSTATLFTIESSQEQNDFAHLFLDNVDVKFVYIGLKYESKTKAFQWVDGTGADSYHHWNDQAKLDGSLPCVHAMVGKGQDSTWVPNNCKDTANLIACQLGR